MRSFNKVFVVALPRCATVTMSDALGILGVKTAHLGRIYGEPGAEHNNPQRLIRMHQQLASGCDKLDILDQCDGLADYPVCCMDIVSRLDKAYPGSLFINVRRDTDNSRWLQSVERQFVGLQLLKQRSGASKDEREFMQVMLSFREMTFGSSVFQPTKYTAAYQQYQTELQEYFGVRPSDFLSVELETLGDAGFGKLAEFLDCTSIPADGFPFSNAHSIRPRDAFYDALRRGEIKSQTGITPA
ncbi:MAG: sulfotransferase [Pirellulaceae bacterium]